MLRIDQPSRQWDQCHFSVERGMAELRRDDFKREDASNGDGCFQRHANRMMTSNVNVKPALAF